MNSIISLAITAVVFLIYCILFHKKSIRFVVGIGLFAVYFLIMICDVVYNNNIYLIPKIQAYDYIQDFYVLRMLLENLKVFAFVVIIAILTTNKRKTKQSEDGTVIDKK